MSEPFGSGLWERWDMGDGLRLVDAAAGEESLEDILY